MVHSIIASGKKIGWLWVHTTQQNIIIKFEQPTWEKIFIERGGLSTINQSTFQTRFKSSSSPDFSKRDPQKPAQIDSQKSYVPYWEKKSMSFPSKRVFSAGRPVWVCAGRVLRSRFFSERSSVSFQFQFYLNCFVLEFVSFIISWALFIFFIFWLWPILFSTLFCNSYQRSRLNNKLAPASWILRKINDYEKTIVKLNDYRRKNNPTGHLETKQTSYKEAREVKWG